MKICLVSDTLPGYHKKWSGAELVCWRLGEMLRKEGHEVFFITSPFNKKKNVLQGKKVFPLFTLLNIFSRFIPFFPSFFTHFPVDLFSILQATILLKRIKPDIVHFHAKKLFLPVMTANIFLRISTVFTVLDYFLVCPRNTFLKSDGQICLGVQGDNCFKCLFCTKNFLKKMLQPLWLKKLLSRLRAQIFYYFVNKKIDVIIALTKTSKKRLIRKGIISEKIKVVYYQLINSGINKVNSSPCSNDYTILFVGSFYPHKGLHVLIQAVPLVISKIHKANFKVVGTGDDIQKRKIKETTNNLGINEYIEFLGHKDNEEVLELITSSDVIVIAEQWLSDFGPVALLESVALGKPVIASKIGSAPEFIQSGYNGFLVAPNQPSQFAEKLIWVLRNRDLAMSFSRRAKRDVQFLIDGSQEKKIVELYKYAKEK